MAPTVEALTALARAVEAIGPRHGNLPTAESEAMRESLPLRTSTEQEVAAGRPHQPDTHTFGRMTLWAAADCVRAFAATSLALSDLRCTGISSLPGPLWRRASWRHG